MKESKHRIRLQTKFTFATLILAIVLCIGLAVMSYFSFKDAIETRYEEQIAGIVNSAAALVDSSKVRSQIETSVEEIKAGQWPSVMNDPEFKVLHEQFLMLAEENGLEYLFSYAPTPEGFYLYTQNIREGEDYYGPVGDFNPAGVNYSYEDVDLANRILVDPTVDRIYISDTQYGYLITAFAVVPDENGEPFLLVGADLSMDEVKDTLRQYLLTVCLIAAAIVLVFIVLYLFYLRRGMIRPLQMLVDGAVRFVKTGEGHESTLQKMNVQVGTGDEIEDLANAFNKMSEDIVTYIHDLTAVTAEKERIGAELNVATTIQASMLPSNFPAFPERQDFDIYATMNPAKEVGGDFYDFFLIDDDHLGVVVADVSGKGVPAALFMVRSMTLIKTQAMTGLNPGAVLTNVNEELCANNEGELFVTVWLGILELSTGKVTFANAGHEQPLVRHDGRYSYQVQKAGFVLGGMEGMRYRDQELQLNPGDALFQYSDGVTEATNAQNQLYGTQRLLDVINGFADMSPDLLLPAMKENIDTFVGEAPQFDDITMLGVVYKGKSE